MPMANPNTQPKIFSLCNALLSAKGGEITALHIALIPEQTDFHTALSSSNRPLELLERIANWEQLDNVTVRPVIRASHKLGLGIVHAAEEENCDLTVMGYTEGKSSAFADELMESVLNQSRTDFIFVKLKDLNKSFHPKKIAVSLGGGSNLDLMVRLAGAVAEHFGGEITFLNILPENYTPSQQADSGKIFIETIQKHSSRALYNIQVLASDNPIDTLVARSENFDLLIVGTTKVGMLQRIVVGNFATQITERAQCDVAIVKVLSISRKLVKGI